MSATDDLLQNAARVRRRASTTARCRSRRPARSRCSRAWTRAWISSRLLGLELGDAHMIRNAGGVVTDDAIRSLAISQRMLGTREIVLLHHTDCGMLTFSDDEFKRSLLDETGIKPAWAVEAFDDLDEDVRQSIARIQASPFIPHKDSVRGFVYDVHTGEVREVS